MKDKQLRRDCKRSVGRCWRRCWYSRAPLFMCVHPCVRVCMCRHVSDVVTFPSESICFVLGLIVQSVDNSCPAGKCHQLLLELLGILQYRFYWPTVDEAWSSVVIVLFWLAQVCVTAGHCDIQNNPCLPFQLDSSVTITCANGKWNKQISCEPVDCGLPDKYHVHPAHFMFPEGTTYGKKSTFQCREPAQLVGEIQIGTSVRRSISAEGCSFSKMPFFFHLAYVFLSGIMWKIPLIRFSWKLLAWFWPIIKAIKQMNMDMISPTCQALIDFCTFNLKIRWLQPNLDRKSVV